MTYRDIKRVLTKIKEAGKVDIRTLSRELDLKEDYLRGVIETLRKEGIVNVSKKTNFFVKPGPKAKKLKTLPEIIIFKLLTSEKEIPLNDLPNLLDIPADDLKAGIGKLVSSKLVKLDKRGGGRTLKLLVKKEPTELAEAEKLLKRILEENMINLKVLTKNDSKILERLSKRPGYIDIERRVTEEIEPTEKIFSYIESTPAKPIITKITPELILSRSWANAEFKKYDLNERFFRLYPGRIHPLREVIREIREVFVSMGFEEAHGPLVEVAFKNFDMLFQPQDHPARDMQDTFYIMSPEYGELSYPRRLIYRVKRTHEDGWRTGSSGWRSRWNITEAKRLVLRTHTTSVSIEKVYEIGERPAKIFSIGRVFRNETVDYKHLAEFMQIDGIVINKKANLRELMGIIKEFYSKLGFKEVKFWPSYFPYTEPSIQPSIYVNKWGKWLELGGAGIFRPEVTIPLGVKWPVLAWGLGIERLLMIRYNIDDIRLIYNNNLDWLRELSIRYKV
jgi:phenylalanyl-tRNA synthetase alpha chain